MTKDQNLDRVDVDRISERMKWLLSELDISYKQAAVYANYNVPNRRFSAALLHNLGHRYQSSRVSTVKVLSDAFHISARFFIDEPTDDFALYISQAKRAYAGYLVSRIWEKYGCEDAETPLEQRSLAQLWSALEEAHDDFRNRCDRIYLAIRQKAQGRV